MQKQPKIVFISWAPYCSRSDNIARELGGKSYMVYYEFFGSNYFTIAFKYLLQTIKTLNILFRERPDAVLVMNPSVLATLPVYLYCQLAGKVYIIDAHTGVLSKESLFRRIVFIQKFFSKHAAASIITSKGIAKRLIEWGADYIIIPDVPVRIGKTRRPTLTGEANITLVNTYASDEPLEIFLTAAEKLVHVNFHVTGKIKRQARELTSSSYKNVLFTDFLPYEDYFGLLLASDIVIVLPTRDLTMQRGAYEAIYLGKPVVTSGWEILKNNFPKGAVFVENTVEGITQGINDALNRKEQLTKEAEQLRDEKIQAWQKYKDTIFEQIQSRNIS